MEKGKRVGVGTAYRFGSGVAAVAIALTFPDEYPFNWHGYRINDSICSAYCRTDNVSCKKLVFKYLKER